MPKSFVLGEYEHLVLLSVARLGRDAFASRIREEIAAVSGRRGTRGALYRTLDRLEGKGYLSWETEAAGSERGGLPRRRFAVTPAGINALRACRSMLETLWTGLDTIFEAPQS